jgi:hypothetical protein
LQRPGQAEQVIFHSRQFEIGGAQIHFTGNNFKPLEGGTFDFVEQAAFTQQDAIRAGTLGFFQAQTAGGIGLRVEVKKEHALAQRGEARGKIDGGGSLAHAAFLVGYRNYFGWHPPDLMTSAPPFQAHNAFQIGLIARN